MIQKDLSIEVLWRKYFVHRGDIRGLVRKKRICPPRQFRENEAKL